ncbi:MAG: hypothetical protein ACP5HK_06820 [Acidilobus sp.]
MRVTIRRETFYACEFCGLIYETPDKANACESWCGSHGSCNIEIAKGAVGSIGRYKGLRISSARP